MKCKVCGEDLQTGQAVIKFEGTEMATPVSVEGSYSGGVCHVDCIHGLETIVRHERRGACEVALCVAICKK